MEFNEIVELLQTLLYARGACGEEEEVSNFVSDFLRKLWMKCG